MSSCNACNVQIKHNSNCPLCGKHIKDCDRSERYPTYYASGEVRAKKVILFCFVLIGGLLLFLDIITTFQGWSAVNIGGLVIIWFAVVKPIFERIGFPAIMVQIVLVICVFAVALELIGEPYTEWPSSYLIPSAVAFGITAIIFSTVFKKVKWGEISIYITILALVNLCIVILGLLKVVPHVTVAFCVLGFSIACLLTFKYFLSKSFNESFKKKMRV